MIASKITKECVTIVIHDDYCCNNTKDTVKIILDKVSTLISDSYGRDEINIEERIGLQQ